MLAFAACNYGTDDADDAGDADDDADDGGFMHVKLQYLKNSSPRYYIRQAKHDRTTVVIKVNLDLTAVFPGNRKSR